MNNENGKIWFGLGLDNEELKRDAEQSRNIIKGIGDKTVAEGARIDNAYKKITSAATAIFSAVAIKQFGMELIDITGKFQTFQAVLTNTLQSPLKALQAMQMLQDFAATTPFQVDALTGAFVKLANQGFIPTRAEMMKLGDLASSTGKGFDQLAEAIIDAQTGEFERLKEFGIRASKEGEKVTFTFKEQKTQVDFAASSIRDYVLSLGELKGVAGANAEIAKTLTGQYSNLQDTITQTMNKIGQSSEGALSGALSGTAYLVEHYEEIGRILGVLIASYGTYKAAVLAYAVAQKIAVSAGNIKAFFELAKGIKTAKDAQIALNLAMGANPFIKLASILMTIGGLIWAFAKNTSDATDEVTGLNKAMKDAGAEFEKEAAKVQTLQDVMNNSKVAYDERKRALNELKSIIPGYNAELNKEGILINNNTEAIKSYLTQLEKQIKLKAIQEEKEEAIRKKRQLEKQVRNQEVIYQRAKENIPDVVYGGDAGIEGQRHALNNAAKAERELNRLQSELTATNKTLGELDGEFISTSKDGSKAEDTIKSFSEQLQTAAGRVTTLKSELAQLKAGKGNEADFVKAIKSKQEELTEAEQSYNLLLGVDKKYLKEKETEFEKAEKAVKDMQAKAASDLYSEAIALKRKQITDKIALIEFDRDNTIAVIEAEKQAYLQLAVASGVKLSDVDTSMYDNRIKTVTLSAKIDTDNVNVEEADKIKTQLEALQQEFETYEQERTRIQAEYAAKRKKMYEADGETLKQGFNQGNVDELNRAQTEALNAVDLEIANREASFNAWVSKLVGLGLEQLEEALQTAKKTLNSDNANLSDKEKASLRAKITALEKQIEVEKTKSPEQRAAEKSKKQWGDTIKVMNEVQDTVGNIINSFDGLDEATKEALSAATNIAGGIIGMITGIQALAVTGAEAIKGVERASVILAVIGTAVQIITAIFNLAGAAEKRHQEALKEIANNKLAMQREYNQLLFEQNMLLKEASSVFGVDEITKAINAFAQYKDQLTKYKEELKGTMPAMNSFERMTNDMLGSYNKRLNDYKNGIGALNEITVKTGHVKTGLFGWGKGRDIYTSILQVYPDIIDKEGKLNIERAKAIVATQTMSDENKNLLQSLIDMQENAEKAMEELNDYLNSTFGELGGSIMDSITDGITNGTDAWKEFGKTGASVLEKLGKQIAYELFFSEKFKSLQNQLQNIYGSGKSPEEVAKDARDAVSNFYNGIGNDMQNAEDWLKQWQDEAERQGLELWSGGEREASKKGFASMSQESADELNGRFTAIQGHTYSISELLNRELKANTESVVATRNLATSMASDMKALTENSAQALKHLAGIEVNTDKLHAIDTNISDMGQAVKSLKSSIDDISLKGIHIKR